jgi:hypothetical protein
LTLRMKMLLFHVVKILYRIEEMPVFPQIGSSA